MRVVTKLDIRDRVYIDGCRGLVGVITGVIFRADNRTIYEVGWIADGSSKEAQLEEWRLTKVPEEAYDAGS